LLIQYSIMTENTQHINKSTWITAAVFGVLLAISGIQHGFFEILQGNKITETFIIQSIGMDNQRWMNGEEAFTLLHNFFITGFSAIMVSVVILIWSIGFLKKSFGPPIFFLLFVLLTLVGGGIAHVLFFLPVWLFSQRINKEISWKGKGLSSRNMKILSASWIYLLIFSSLLFLAALELLFFGIPGATYETISAITYGTLLMSLIILHLTFISALSRDIRTYQIRTVSPTF
jgi:hypothetical protein